MRVRSGVLGVAAIVCGVTMAVAADPPEGLLPNCPAGFYPTSPHKSSVVTNVSAGLYSDGAGFYPALAADPPCAQGNWFGPDGIDLSHPTALIGTAEPNVIRVSKTPRAVEFDIEGVGISAPLDTYMPACMPAASASVRVCESGASVFLYRLADEEGNFSGKWTIATESTNPYFQFVRQQECPSPLQEITNPGYGVPCSYQLHFLVDGQGQPLLQRSMQLVMSNAAGGSGTSTNGPFVGYNEVANVAIPMLFVAGGAIEGSVTARDGFPIEGLTLELTGTDADGASVSETTTSDEEGNWLFDGLKSGTYTVEGSGDPEGENGGVVSVEAEVGGSCPGDADGAKCHLDDLPSDPVEFVYTPCAAAERLPNGKPPTSCPIVFVPGFLGTRIACPGEELWPNIPNARFGEMALQIDGYSNVTDAGACAAGAFAVPGRDGLVATAAGTSVYQTTIDFLDRIAPDRWDAYTYDWRRAVPVSVDGLDAVVDQLREDTGASRVVLMAHSMGGLVSRVYVGDAGRADKVVRFLTLGTPYWGAPKTHFALLEGDTDAPGSPILDLDVFTNARDLQRFAQTAFGAFWLYPSANYGSWLSIGGVAQDAGGVDAWIGALDATPALLSAARAGHAQLDGFLSNGVDYRVMVGAGLATVTAVGVRSGLIDAGRVARVGQWADLTYGSGDGTVPARSATQGAIDTGAPLGESVPIHYACGVGHVALPGDAGVDARVEDFLLKGEAIDGPDDACPYSGVQVRSFVLDILQPGARVVLNDAPATARAAGESLSVHEAAARGLVSLLTFGDRTTVVLDARTGATLRIDGAHQALQVQTIASTGDGPWRSYAAGSGALVVDRDGAVTVDGVAAKEVRLKKKGPRTKARIRKKAGAFLVKLRARAANGLGATYYRIGDGPVVTYTGPFTVTKAERAQLRYTSVDAFGALERWRGGRKKR